MSYLIKEKVKARIIFVRHAESSNNIIKELSSENYENARVPDPHLSEVGKKQAEACARYLRKRGINPNTVFSSCFSRALDTAKYIQDEFNCKAQIFRELHEIGGLQYKGKGFRGEGKKYFEEKYPSFILDDSIKEDGWFFNEKKETNEQAYGRIRKFIILSLFVVYSYYQELKQLTEFKCLKTFFQTEENENGERPDFIFVTHGNFLDMAVGQLLFRQQGIETFIQHNNTGITAFDLTEKDRYLIKYLNESNHLEELNIETNEMDKSTTKVENLTLKTHQSQPLLKNHSQQNF